MKPTSPPTPATVVAWCLTDGKPGHRNQLRGLTDALGRLMTLQVCWLDAPVVWQSLANFARGTFPAGTDQPDPQLILGAGHKTHWALLAARRARGGRTIVLMKPTLPARWFDLCFVPEHDGAGAGPRVIATRGALHAVTPSSQLNRQPRHGLFLIGGPSPHHRWDDDAMASQVRLIVQADPGWQWELTTSRRTPRAFLDRLGTLPHLDITPVEKTDRDWVATRLARAASVWVTADSISMVYESVTAGAPTGLLPVPARRRSRVVRGLEQLVADDWVTTFANWHAGAALHAPPATLHEAARCARLIWEQLLS